MGEDTTQTIYNISSFLLLVDGHIGGETPGPIPNPAVKSAYVPYCTVFREGTGTMDRCLHLYLLFKGGNDVY